LGPPVVKFWVIAGAVLLVAWFIKALEDWMDS